MAPFLYRAVHLILACVLLWLAYCYLDSDDVFNSGRAFTYMASVGTRQEWGMVHLFFGLLGLFTTFSTEWRIRVSGAGVLCVAHITVAFLFYLGNRHAIGTGIFGLYAALAGFLAFATAHSSQRYPQDMAPFDPSR